MANRSGDAGSLYLRCRAHPDRPLRRRARQGAHRRPRRGTDQGAGRAQRQGRLVAARRSLFRLRQSVRRRQPQCRAHGAVARRAPRLDPRHHRQPAMRLRAQCGRRCRSRHSLRRDGVRHRRRRRIDDAGAVRHGQGRRGVLALGGDLRHHARLALHQSAAQGAIRRRLHGRDRRERRRGIPGHAGRPRCIRAALAAARWQGRCRRLFRRRDRAGRGARRQSRSHLLWTRTSIRGRRPRWKTCRS